MPATHLINVDLAKVFRTSDRKGLLHVLTWGAPVDVVQITSTHVEVKATDFEKQADGSVKPKPIVGFIVPPKGTKPASVVIERGKNRILKVDFVDVQQGDGAVIETPTGKVMLIDGGDNQMFARYLATRFRGTTPKRPKEIDCILVSHGDADHFAGLTEIHKSETNKTKFKQLFIHPRRVYHNGIVKRPGKRGNRALKVTEQLGKTVAMGKDLVIIAPECHKMKNGAAVITKGVVALDPKARKPFFAFSRAAFGLVSVRTDGDRLLVCTNSGRTDLKEAYAFEMDNNGKPVPVPLRSV